MMTTEPKTLRHKIGTCPACHCGLWADVDVAVYVMAPTLTADGKAIVNARPEFQGMRMAHLCARDPEDDGWIGTDSYDDVTRPATTHRPETTTDAREASND